MKNILIEDAYDIVNIFENYFYQDISVKSSLLTNVLLFHTLLLENLKAAQLFKKREKKKSAN